MEQNIKLLGCLELCIVFMHLY